MRSSRSSLIGLHVIVGRADTLSSSLDGCTTAELFLLGHAAPAADTTSR